MKKRTYLKTAFLTLICSVFSLVAIANTNNENFSTPPLPPTNLSESNTIIVEPMEDIVLCDTLATADNCGGAISICGPTVSECPTYTVLYNVANDAGTTIAEGVFPPSPSPSDCVLLGIHDFGIYTVTYVVADDNNNSSIVTYTIENRDCKAPIASCVDGFVAELPEQSCTREFLVSDFDDGSFDECNGPVVISFSATELQTSRIFEDVGTQTYDLYVTDAVGNTSSCNGFFVLQPSIADWGVLDCGFGTDIFGEIRTEDGENVAQVLVSMSGNGDATYTTQDEGIFEFIVELEHDYTIAVEKDINPSNGVSTFDLVLMRKHILGIQLLSSPYKMIAADVNNSGGITTLDMVKLRRIILNIDTEFEDNESWRFVDASYLFPNPANPWAEVFPEVININDIMDDAEIHFTGIKIGDVNGSAAPNNLNTIEHRAASSSLILNADDKSLKAGETYTIDFTADMTDISGYQFTLNYHDLDLIDIVEGVATTNNFGIFPAEGVITTSWEGEAAKDVVLFSLVVTTQRDAYLSELLTISSHYTRAEAYKGEELLNVSLDFEKGLVDSKNTLYQNTPNPFQDLTTVSFHLAEAAEAIITINDVTGKVVKVMRGDFVKGLNTVQFDSETLNGSGLLFYTLKTEGFMDTKKMLMIE